MTMLNLTKLPAESKLFESDFSAVLATGEVITTVQNIAVSPTGLDIGSAITDGYLVQFRVAGGTDNTTYKISVLATTNQGNTLESNGFLYVGEAANAPFVTGTPDAFANIIDSVVAGTSAYARVTFTLPGDIDTSNGLITYEVRDNTGTIYDSGNATGYIVASLQTGENNIVGEGVVNIPSNIPVNVVGTKYQIRWKLLLGSNTFYSFENFTVLPPTLVPQGAEDAVELFGDDANVSVVLPFGYSSVGFQIFKGNTPVTNFLDCSPSAQPTADGYLYTGQISTTLIPQGASLEPYNVVWSYQDGTLDAGAMHEQGRMFIVNPSIMSAVKDVLSVINRAKATVGGAEDITFSVPDVLTFLKQGADLFNGIGHPTIFTMVNATGPVRFFWLAYSQVVALRAQYLAEGNKAFDFSGQSVNLNVDRTQYYEQMASNLETQANNDATKFKKVLSKRGLISGDGNVNPTALQQSAVGSLGIALSPVSNLGMFGGNSWWGNRIY